MIMTRRSPLKVLAIDTTTTRGSVALLSDREVVAELRLLSVETHSARLLKSIRFIMESAGWDRSELGLIAVGIGPGSFTGIRIGIATALGLSQTLKIPFAGISGLEALAHSCSGICGQIGVVMDAHREQVYFQEFDADPGRIKRAGNPILMRPEDLKARLEKGRFHLVGDGATRYARLLGVRSRGYPNLLENDLFISGQIGRLASSRKRIWRSGTNLDCDPLYIRPPDARKPKGPRR